MEVKVFRFKPWQKWLISALFVFEVIVIAVMKFRDLHFVTPSVNAYAYFFGGLLAFAFLRVFFQLEKKQKTILLIVMPLVTLIIGNIFMIILIGLMSISALSRYERDLFTKLLKVAYLIILVIAMINTVMAAPMYFGYQEDTMSLFHGIYPSPDNEYLVEVSNYRVVGYSSGSKVKFKLADREYYFTYKELDLVERTEIRTLDLKWLDNTHVKINGITYEIQDDKMVEVANELKKIN